MRRTFGLLVAGAAAMAAMPAGAGPLTIAPTTLEIAPSRQSAMLTVTNDSDQPVDLQIRAYAWSQAAGTDELTPTDDLVISPAVMTVAPRKKQVFRILRVRTTQTGPEPSYRLRLNELPRPDSGGVVVNLEFSLPVFVSASEAAPKLAWSRAGAAVSVFNIGNRRARITNLALGSGADAVPLGGASSAYILAGARRTFALPPTLNPVAPDARLVGASDFGPINVADTALATR